MNNIDEAPEDTPLGLNDDNPIEEDFDDEDYEEDEEDEPKPLIRFKAVITWEKVIDMNDAEWTWASSIEEVIDNLVECAIYDDITEGLTDDPVITYTILD